MPENNHFNKDSFLHEIVKKKYIFNIKEQLYFDKYDTFITKIKKE